MTVPKKETLESGSGENYFSTNCNTGHSPVSPKRVHEKQTKWGKAKKKPVEVHFRKVQDGIEIIHTLEGDLIARSERDFIIKGVNGEEYPIRKTIFYKTYDVLITADGEATKGFHDVEEFYKDE